MDLEVEDQLESASIKLFDFIYREVDRGKYIVSILFDFSKAFDSGKQACTV